MKTILIIEDDWYTRNLYANLLSNGEYEVIEAGNAIDGYNKILGKKIDLILLDIMLPEIDGSITYKVIKLFHKNIKVIVSSIYPAEKQKEIIQEAFDYYDKSEGKEALLKKVHNALNDL